MAKFNSVDILKDSFGFYGKNPVIALPFVAYLIVAFLILALPVFSLLELPKAGLLGLSYLMKNLAILFLLAILAAFLMSFAYACVILKVNKPNLKTSEMLVQGLFKSFKLFIATLAYSVLVGIGFLLLIVPGIYLLVRLGLFAPAAVLGDGFGISESWKLTKGKFWDIFVLYLLIFLMSIIGVIPIVGQIIATLLIAPVAITALTKAYLILKKYV